MEELKPCPFCGEKRYLWENTDQDWMANKEVRCGHCAALGPPCSTWEQAKIAWNKRREKIHDLP